MDANTIVASCAMVIALAALGVSVVQTRAIWRHNRQSVRPMLQLRWSRGYDSPITGLQLFNRGLGPAVVTKSVVYLDGRPIGDFSRATLEQEVRDLPAGTRLNTLRDGPVLQAGYGDFLISLVDGNEETERWFWNLITARLQLVIHYESLYGGEDFIVTRVARELLHPAPLPEQ